MTTIATRCQIIIGSTKATNRQCERRVVPGDHRCYRHGGEPAPTSSGHFDHRYTDAYVKKLHTAFTKVQNREHWKNPINAVVDLNDAEMALLRDAIPFFTGSVPEFEAKKGAALPRCRYRVRAVGYYVAIGS